MGTSHFNVPKEKLEPTSPSIQPSRSGRSTMPSLSTNALAHPHAPDPSVQALTESKLKRQSLECMVAVLRSLVIWGTQASKPMTESPVPTNTHTRSVDDQIGETGSAETAVERTSLSATAVDLSRTVTPDITDDPGRFESARQKKTTLLEGVRKFNFKPKRVRYVLSIIQAPF